MFAAGTEWQGRVSIWHRVAVSCAVFASIAAWSAAVRAQEPAAAEVAMSREQFRAGMDAARQNHWEDALRAFTRAYELFPRVPTLLNIGTAQAQTARVVEAAETYRRFLREATSPPASAQRPAAESALRDVERRISRATLTIDGLLDGDTVQLDGRRLPRAMLGSAMPINPGSHTLVVTRGSTEVGRSTFDAAEGATREVSIRAAAIQASAVVTPPASAVVVSTPSTARVVASLSAERAANAHASPPPARGGVLSSPVFWVISGLVVAGGATAGIYFGVFAPRAGSPYIGNLGTGQVTLP